MNQYNRPLSHPAAERNREVIAKTLRAILPESGKVLEVGSGTGVHAAYFAKTFPNLTFQPTDRDTTKLNSIKAWITETGLTNIDAPLTFDLLKDPAPLEKADAVISINVIHIAPWEATLALIKMAGALLAGDAPLIFYGPFHRSDVETTESNKAFDAKLKAENPGGGLRHVDEIATIATQEGFSPPLIFEMPSNNLLLVFKKI